MADDEPFVDYYKILNVNPNSDPKTLEAAYRHLAKMYHPDHIDTANVTRFNEVIEAYRALRNPNYRTDYDLIYADLTGFEFSSSDEGNVDANNALSDAEVHANILLALYKRRREHAHDAGVGHYAIQEMLNCSDDLVEFHLWYLKAKGFIETTEQGTLAITIEGVDHVISTSRTAMREKLLLAQSGAPEKQAKS